MPMSRALQYRHCDLRAAGYWTVPPSGDPGEQMKRLRAAKSMAPSQAEPKTAAKSAWSERLRQMSGGGKP